MYTLLCSTSTHHGTQQGVHLQGARVQIIKTSFFVWESLWRPPVWETKAGYRNYPESSGRHEAMSGALPLGVMGRDPDTKPRDPFLGADWTGTRMASSGLSSPVSH